MTRVACGWHCGAAARCAATTRPAVLTDQIQLPARQVSACTFGDADLSTLYITTSRQGLGEDAEPTAGAVFAARVPYKGRAPFAFAG